jgi:hypothetical protein
MAVALDRFAVGDGGRRHDVCGLAADDRRHVAVDRRHRRAGTAAAGALLGVWFTAPGPAHLVVPVLLLATAAVAGLAFPWLKAPSVAGRRAMDEIEGFRLYLGTADEDRLNAMDSPEKTPELFERFLPYAVALDVQNAWAKRFASVLAAAGATAAATAWYAGSHDHDWETTRFLSRTILAASFRKRSRRLRRRLDRAIVVVAAAAASGRPAAAVVAAGEQAGSGPARVKGV